MKFKEFIDEDIKEFRKIKIGLLKNKSKEEVVVSKISDKYDIAKNIINEINSLNKELDKYYKGKFKFDFCIREDISIECLRLKKENIKDLFKEYIIKANDSFAKAKTELERKLSGN